MTISFDSSPLIYQLILFAAALGLGGLSFLLQHQTLKYSSEKLFLIGAGFLLLLGRMPVLVFNRELNADESQMLAQAMTLAKDPVYWRSVDGTTGGPLSSYFLILVAIVRGGYDYVTAHSGALLLVFFTVFFLFKALVNWLGTTKAILGTLPVVIFYSFARYPDFVHYTSEHFPIAVLACCIWLTSLYDSGKSWSVVKAISLGVLLALIPFGKIQALPLAGAIAAYLFWVIGIKRNWRTLVLIFSGGIGIYSVIALTLAFSGVLDDFITFYIQGNLQYKNDTPAWQNILALFSQSADATDILPIIISLFFSVLLFLSQIKHAGRFNRSIWLGAALLVASIFAMSRTGSGYSHYLLFLTIPLTIILTNFISIERLNTLRIAASYILPPLLGGVLVFVLQVRQSGVFNTYDSGQGMNQRLPFTETAATASRFLQKNDYLVVWGWNCQYYVECSTPQGVAENHSIRSIYGHSMQKVYQKRYLQDMLRNKPAVFIDATGKNSLWLQDTLTQSYRSFPALAQYIDHHYTLVGEPDGNRLFVRRDRNTK